MTYKLVHATKKGLTPRTLRTLKLNFKSTNNTIKRKVFLKKSVPGKNNSIKLRNISKKRCLTSLAKRYIINTMTCYHFMRYKYIPFNW